jgi:CheY-like chemotaxis protein
LVVDDNSDAADSMSQVLSLAGFAVETCYDGPTALALAGKVRPDACVLDINMPGMTGYELARRLRELFPDRPPVFATITAYGDYGHLERAADAGFDLQFTKPADLTEVARQLEECIRGRAAPGTTAPEPGYRIGPDRPLGNESDRSFVRRLLDRVVSLWARPVPAPR